VTGTGLSMCQCPDSWLLLALALGVAQLGARTGGSSGFWASVRDLLTASALVASVGFAASGRISAESARVTLVAGRTATLRGCVCVPQPSRTGGSVVVGVRPEGALSGCASSRRRESGRHADRHGRPSNLTRPRNQGGYNEAAYLSNRNLARAGSAGFPPALAQGADGPSGVVGAYVAPVRQWIRESVRKRMTGEERAFLLALTLGERGSSLRRPRPASRLGLVHILSVSATPRWWAWLRSSC
jgi:predicted membrane metal-binding protein